MTRATSVLSGYRLMWLLCMFDLPVGTETERKAAGRFRLFLQDQGFEMAQFSVYMRYCAGRDEAETYVKRIEQALPRRGKVHVFQFTDKQYETSRSYRGANREPGPRNPDQLILF